MSRWRQEIIGDATLICGDCREVLPTLPRVDAVVTSPPYAQQRQYENGIDEWDSLVPPAISVCDAGQIFVNLGLVHRDGEVIEYWRTLVDAMRANGWRFFGWYVWDQGPGMPGDWAGRLAPSHEWVLHFNKFPRRPNKTVEAKYAGYIRSTPQRGMRGVDGQSSGWCHGRAETQESRIPDSVLRISRNKLRGNIENEHPAIYPIRLPAHIATAYTDEGETILDPFMGSGTTGVACIKLGRKFIGIEIEPKYFDIACKRIEEAWRQPRLFEEPRVKPVQEALDI